MSRANYATRSASSPNPCTRSHRSSVVRSRQARLEMARWPPFTRA